jgi:hypothetical protein
LHRRSERATEEAFDKAPDPPFDVAELRPATAQTAGIIPVRTAAIPAPRPLPPLVSRCGTPIAASPKPSPHRTVACVRFSAHQANGRSTAKATIAITVAAGAGSRPSRCR